MPDIGTNSSSDAFSTPSACLDACWECARVCNETLSHCLEMGGAHALPNHIRVMRDCVEICETTAHFLMRDSPSINDVCAICAEICTECAESCATFKEKFMNECEKACRDCAAECRKMVKTIPSTIG